MVLGASDTLGILTSGGDAPGMNAALRGVVRAAQACGLRALGIEDGFRGLLAGQSVELAQASVDDASRRGGTLLGTARSAEFRTAAGLARAREQVASLGLAGLVVIGGNGSLAGALALRDAHGARGRLRIAGIPASIDNDLAATTMAIGVDTALNTIVEACDRICDTATAHRRVFIVEVMGRECGYLAMAAGIAACADLVLVPEAAQDEAELHARVEATVRRAHAAGRKRVLILKAEGVGVATARIKQELDARVGSERVDSRVTVLGHVVRGGVPTCFDRMLGARLGHAAVYEMLSGEEPFMAGWTGPGTSGRASKYDPHVTLTPLSVVLEQTAQLVRGEGPLASWRRDAYRHAERALAP